MTARRATLVAAVASALAAVPLSSAFSDGRWIWPTLAAIAVVAATGMAARTVRASILVVLLVETGMLALTLTVMFARSVAVLGFLPGPASLHTLGHLVTEAFTAIALSPSPITASAGLVLMTAAGLGTVAIVVDTIAVSLHHPDIAGLPILAVYTVAVVVDRDGVGWPLFTGAAAGWVALLLTDANRRLGQWGRTITTGTGHPGEPGEPGEPGGITLVRLGRRLGAGAVVVAVVIPALVPGLTPRLPWGVGGTGGSGPASTRVNVVNPILDLRQSLVQPQNSPVLTYRTSDGRPEYLRMTTLDNVNGNTWAPAQLTSPANHEVGRGLPPPEGLSDTVATTAVTTTVHVANLAEKWLPLPMWTMKVGIKGRWLYDTFTRNVFSLARTTQGLTYTADGIREQLNSSVLQSMGSYPVDVASDLELPADLPAPVAQDAARVTAGATTTYEQAVLLQNWFRNPRNFTYSTTAPNESGVSAIEAFLQAREGFCVQFASTMAVMARTLGIPARVDVGFTGGVRQPDGSYLVTAHDAHAWPELYFSGVGWVPFEPTPSLSTAKAPSYAPGGSTAPGTGTGTPDGTANAPMPAPATGARAPQLHGRLGDPANPATSRPGATAAGTSHTGSAMPGRVAAVAALGLLIVLCPAGVRIVVRRRRWTAASRAQQADPSALVEAAWDELGEDALDLGYAWPASRTPRQVATELTAQARLDASTARELVALSHLVERARYAEDRSGSGQDGPGQDGPGQDGPAGAVRGRLKVVRAGLLRSQTWAVKARAVVLPRSSLLRMRQIGTRVADGLDAMDVTMSQVWRRLARRAA